MCVLRMYVCVSQYIAFPVAFCVCIMYVIWIQMLCVCVCVCVCMYAICNVIVCRCLDVIAIERTFRLPY